MTETIQFYFDLMSEPSRALYIFLKLTGIPTEFHPISLKQCEHLTDNYRDNVNRFKKVPAIVVNGFQLSESVAIFRYLANRYEINDNWYPKNDQVRARIDEYLEWHHLNTRLYGLQYFWMYFMKPRGVTFIPKLAKSTAPVDDYLKKTLDEIEHLWLKPGCFISGTDQISFADVLAATEIEQATISGFNPGKKRPNLSEWMKNVQKLTNPFYDEANAALSKLREESKR